jgi:hypothetical protein
VRTAVDPGSSLQALSRPQAFSLPAIKTSILPGTFPPQRDEPRRTAGGSPRLQGAAVLRVYLTLPV